MKLHFYIMHIRIFDQLKLEYSECEVIEKPKTYTPVNGFPKGYYGCYVRKDDIGTFKDETVILLERDDEKAKSIFKNAYNNRILEIKGKLERAQSFINAVDEFKG